MTPQRISTPSASITATSRRISSRGKTIGRARPTASMPAGTGSVSKTTGRKPSSARSWAADRPAGPAPMMATRWPSAGVKCPPVTGPQQGRHLLGVGGNLGDIGSDRLQDLARVGRTSGPACSQAKRFRARMAMGRSLATNRPSASTRGTLPRRQAASQGAPQTRPQIEANGLGPRAIR